jgi:cold shock CspA family protein
MENIIAIYGATCSLKSEVAEELSRITGFKLTNRGEKATTQAKLTGIPTAGGLPEEFHRELDAETLRMTERDEKLMIFESTFMDAVLARSPRRQDIFFVRLSCDDAVRDKRWHARKEEGGGRTRQLGESVAARDEEDAKLRARLYGTTAIPVEPVLDLDTSKRSAVEVALEIWEAFEAESGLEVVTNKPVMDKAAARGIFPGPTTGTVKRYIADKTPFGGYITDEKSGQDIYVHKSALGEGLDALQPGQKVAFEIVADSFGGFKATKVAAA